MHGRILALLGALAGAVPMVAGAQEQMTAEAFLASLEFRSGSITLPGGIATVTLPEGYHYLSPEDTERVLVTAWGNPPGNETLGMILGGPGDVLAEDAWAVVIAYEEDGHVSDADAHRIDYAELLAAMRATSRASNEARIAAGYQEVELVGWAAEPRYDDSDKKLYWAKELRFGDIPVNTLNYNVRVLGREGVLVLNAIATVPQLREIEIVIPAVLAMTEFNPGYRYTDFDASVDRVAAYGIGALIAGEGAAETGAFAKLTAALAALENFWVVAVIAIGAGLAGVFHRARAKASPAPS